MNDIFPIPENHLSRFESWDQANEAKKKAAWKALDKIKVSFSLELWLETLCFHTARAYRYGMLRLAELRLIDLESTLQAFSQINHNAVIDQIKLVNG
ncbi:hypothetical protein KKA14_19040, partial [bacterium]|nr:hypothetical protein [bacterium]